MASSPAAAAPSGAGAPSSGASSGGFDSGSGSSTGNEGRGGRGGSSLGSPGAEPDVSDYRQAFQSTKRHLQETSSALHDVRSEFEKHRQSTQKDLETVSRLREAFAPETTKKQESPVKKYEQMLDYYIAQGLEAEKRGQPIPLTINAGIELYQMKIEQHREREESQRVLQELREEVNRLKDPQMYVNQMAYSHLDQQIQRSLDNMYGEGQKNIEQKRALFQAITQQLGSHIGQLQQKAPQQWDKIRRDRDMLGRLAMDAVRAHIPPKALEMLAEETLRNTPMSEAELFQAFKEAETIRDPEERQRIRAGIRQEILELRYSKPNRRRD